MILKWTKSKRGWICHKFVGITGVCNRLVANVGEQEDKTNAARLVRMWSKISQKNFGT